MGSDQFLYPHGDLLHRLCRLAAHRVVQWSIGRNPRHYFSASDLSAVCGGITNHHRVHRRGVDHPPSAVRVDHGGQAIAYGNAAARTSSPSRQSECCSG